MGSIKCKSCGLTNFVDAEFCTRCRLPFNNWTNTKIEKHQPRISLVSLLAFAVVAVIVYYMIGGFEKSMNDINAAETNRAASQPRQPDAGLSRTEYDQKRAAQYGSAVQNSNSLAEAQKHNAEINKMMQPSQGDTQK